MVYTRGLSHAGQGDHPKAIEDFTEAIRLDPKYATAYYSRGLGWKEKKENDKAIAEYNEAIKLFQEILTARTRVLGASHPDTLRSLGSLANSYRAAGRHQQASRLHKKALAARQRTLGPDHPSTRASRRNLAGRPGDWECSSSLRLTGGEPRSLISPQGYSEPFGCAQHKLREAIPPWPREISSDLWPSQ